MSKSKKKILAFIDIREHEGHEADIRFTLNQAIERNRLIIFEDFPKKPENLFTSTIAGILNSSLVLLDGTTFDSKLSPDYLIRYGICHALRKNCLFINIKRKSNYKESVKRETFIENFEEFNSYLDFAIQFKEEISKFEEYKSSLKIISNKLPVHSFIVFGINRSVNTDLYEIIKKFSENTNWKPRIVSDIASYSKLKHLANAVSQRSFCIFCLDENENEKIFIGIGLAIGLGRPFLIIKHKDIPLPNSLLGYHGIIEFSSYSQLSEQLGKYTSEFLSEAVFKWEGNTYNDLLSKIEKQFNSIDSNGLEETEEILQDLISVLNATTSKPYALLGEIYREKNRKFSHGNINLLIKAKENYKKALEIQGDYQLYQNAIEAIEKHIQIIELIKEKKYRSIPSLINLIGGSLIESQYFQIKEYLLNVIAKLIEKEEFVSAISLLSAMQIHDKSEEIEKIIRHVLNLAPFETIKALQDTQKYTSELEAEKTKITDQLNLQTLMFQEKLEESEGERYKLNLRLKDISAQLDVLYKTINNLGEEIESAKVKEGLGVIVNFGHDYGWAIYKAITGRPYVIRKKKMVETEKGFVLTSGDIIYDEEGNQIMEYLPREAIIIRPDDENYPK